MKLNRTSIQVSHNYHRYFARNMRSHTQKNPKTHKETKYRESDTGEKNSTIIPTKLKILEL